MRVKSIYLHVVQPGLVRYSGDPGMVYLYTPKPKKKRGFVAPFSLPYQDDPGEPKMPSGSDTPKL